MHSRLNHRIRKRNDEHYMLCARAARPHAQFLCDFSVSMAAILEYILLWPPSVALPAAIFDLKMSYVEMTGIQ